jgi:trigger factor
MPDFSTFTLTRHVAKVAAEELDKALADIAERNRALEDLSPEDLAARGENPGAAKGDVLTIDYIGKIDGVAFEGGTATDTDVDIGGSGFIPGFVEQIEGMRPGETKTIDVTFPAEYRPPIWRASRRRSTSPRSSFAGRWFQRSTIRWRKRSASIA